MRKPMRFLCLAILGMLATAGMAQADEVACFDWSCNPSTLVCTFDASCSTPDQGPVSHRWDWGDGTGVNNTTEIPLTHLYDRGWAMVELTILWFGAPGESVTCRVNVRIPIGPVDPSEYEGRCSSE